MSYNSYLNFFLDILFPPLCALCGKTPEEKHTFLCTACIQQAPLHTTLFCATCSARLPDGKKICHQDAPLRIGGALPYGYEPVQNIVHLLKYQKKTGYAPPLGECIVAYMQKLPFDWKEWTLLPIPLHPKRERERGFNQAELIANHIAERLGMPIVHPLQREKETPAQKDMKGWEERKKNMESAFMVVDSSIQNKNVVLIDDVSTSGATFIAAARALRSAKPRTIIGIAALLAR